MSSRAYSLLDRASQIATYAAGRSDSYARFKEAGDLYQQAANAFKLDDQYTDAGNAHIREAECREQYENVHEAAAALWNAANAFRKDHPDLSIHVLTESANRYIACGRLRQAGDRVTDVAHIYLQVSGDLHRASASLEQAAEIYAQVDAVAPALKCYKDSADIHILLEDYPKALERYEHVAEHSLSSALTKDNVKEYWLMGCLCALAMKDTSLARRNIEKYSTQDPAFASTLQYSFATSMINAFDAFDLATFTEGIKKYYGEPEAVARSNVIQATVLFRIQGIIA